MDTFHLPDGTEIYVDLALVDDFFYLRFPFNRPLLDRVKAEFDGRKWNKKIKAWVFPDTVRNRNRLAALRGTLESMPAWDSAVMHEARVWVKDNCKRDLFPAQRDKMLAFLLTHRRGYLAAEMRTGKTLAVIEALDLLGIEDVLWVGPAKVIESTSREFRKWDSPTRINFMSYDKLRVEESSIDPPQALVFDEATRLKTVTSGRTRAAIQLSCRMSEKWEGSEVVWCLSGYPAPKDHLDWWPQLEVMQPGFVPETSYAFKHRVAIVLEKERFDDPSKTFEAIEGWNEEEVEKFTEEIKPAVLHVKVEDVIPDLPPWSYKQRVCKVEPKILRIAQTLVDQAGSGGKALQALRQLSDGFQYRTKTVTRDGKEVEKREVIKATSPKDVELRKLLKEHEKFKRIIVCGGFQATIDRIKDICLGEGWGVITCDGRGYAVHAPDGDPTLSRETKKATALDEVFQDTETFDFPIAFVMHPGSGGQGLTLNKSPSVVFFSNDFNPDYRMQAKARTGGYGCIGRNVIDLIALGSDRYVIDKLDEREEMARIPLDELHNSLEETNVLT